MKSTVKQIVYRVVFSKVQYSQVIQPWWLGSRVVEKVQLSTTVCPYQSRLYLNPACGSIYLPNIRQIIIWSSVFLFFGPMSICFWSSCFGLMALPQLKVQAPPEICDLTIFANIDLNSATCILFVGTFTKVQICGSSTDPSNRINYLLDNNDNNINNIAPIKNRKP